MDEDVRPAIVEDLMRFRPEGLTPNAWAVLAGVSRTVWADMRRHGNPSRRTLEKLLSAAGSSLAEFEALRIPAVGKRSPVAAAGLEEAGPAWRRAQLPPLPIVASSLGGGWGDPKTVITTIRLRPGEIVGHAPRPASLAGDSSAYAVRVVEHGMWPRFRLDRLLAVSAKQVPSDGDDVLVRLNAPAEADGVQVLIKELVGRTMSDIELRQFNPAHGFRVSRSKVAAIHKVLGELV